MNGISDVYIKLHYLRWSFVHKFLKLNRSPFNDCFITSIFCNTRREINEAKSKYQIPCVNFLLPALILNSPYSSDLAPCDYCWFPKLKMKLKEKQFDLFWTSRRFRSQRNFQWNFLKLDDRCKHCISSEEMYFEWL